MPLELLARGEICRVRPAESQRDSEPLRIADGDVGAEFARRFQQCEGKNICRDDDQCAGVVRLPDEIGVIVYRAISGRILNQRAENCVVEFEFASNRRS